MDMHMQVVPQQSLTMTGTGFGLADYTSHVRIGEYGCEASAWVSDSAVRCKVSSESLRCKVSTLNPKP